MTQPPEITDDCVDELMSVLCRDPRKIEGLPVEGDTMLTRPTSGQEQIEGWVMGARRLCSLDGCGGVRIYVRWPGCRITQPCSRGIIQIAEGVWQIE